MKKIEMLFYSTEPSKKNTGMKYVLFEIVMPSKDFPLTHQSTGEIIYEWGFLEWLGEKWGDIEVPTDWACTVKYWANTLDPAVLLKEESKIVSPHTAPVHIKTGLSGK
jgi:hypothetical protein